MSVRLIALSPKDSNGDEEDDRIQLCYMSCCFYNCTFMWNNFILVKYCAKQINIIQNYVPIVYMEFEG